VKIDVDSMKVSYKVTTGALLQLTHRGLTWAGHLEQAGERCESFEHKGSLDDLHLETIG
jgi:hypothetical protein